MPGPNSGHDRLDLAEHRANDIAAQFPEALSSTEVEQIKRRIRRVVDSIDVIREYPLANADEPAPVFRPVGKEQP